MFSRFRDRARSFRLREPSYSSEQLDLSMAQLHPPHIAEAQVKGVSERHLDPKR